MTEHRSNANEVVNRKMLDRLDGSRCPTYARTGRLPAQAGPPARRPA